MNVMVRLRSPYDALDLAEADANEAERRTRRTVRRWSQ
jgi:hypothetical protein